MIHQALYGYELGHRLLCASNMPDRYADNLAQHPTSLAERCSDLSGHIPYGFEWDRYHTGWWLRDDLYALSMTVNDRTCPRLGCVLTHVIFLAVADVSQCALLDLAALLRDPRLVPADTFRQPLTETVSPVPPNDSAMWPGRHFEAFVCGDDPFLKFSSAAWDHERKFGRRVPSFCTMSLQPRKLGVPTFQLFPAESRGDFWGTKVSSLQ